MADKRPLRDLIAVGESEGAVAKQGAASAYDVIVGFAWQFPEARPTRPITAMTVAGVFAWQRHAIQIYRSRTGEREGFSASGRYQIIRATLVSLEARGVVSEAQLYDADAQDACCDALIDDAGFKRWMAGAIGDDAFSTGLARIWASWPVMSREQGAHRVVEAGQSYYAGDGKNAAHITPDQVRAAFAAMKPRAVPGAGSLPWVEPVPQSSPGIEARVAALEATVARLREALG